MSAAAAPVLSAEIADKRFGSEPVLGPISLTLVRGERVAITGPSGAGKTTLLRILAGLDDSHQGRVRRPERTVMMFQEPALLPWRDAEANVTLPSGAETQAARALLEQVGLAGLERRFPGQLSLGQQRRLALARSLAARPDLMLMDEPLASLDPDTAAQMRALIAGLLDAQRAAAVIVTHDLEEARALAGRVLRLAGRPARLSAAG